MIKWGYILILCAVTGTVRGQAKKNNVSIPRKTGKSTIVTHGTIRVKEVMSQNVCVGSFPIFDIFDIHSMTHVYFIYL